MRSAVLPESFKEDAGMLLESTPAGMAISGLSKQRNDIVGLDANSKPKIISTENIVRKFKIVN